MVTSTLRRCLATMAVMAMVLAIGAALSQPRSPERASAATPEFVPLASPQRLLDSRPLGEPTTVCSPASGFARLAAS